MVDGTDALQTLAEIALGFAGFSGVVVALRPEPGQGSQAFLRIVNLLGTSLTCLFFALLPLGLLQLDLREDLVWRACAGLFALAHGIGWFTSTRSLFRLPPGDRDAYPRSLLVVLTGGSGVMLSVLLGVTVGLVPSAAGFYFLGLMWLLVVSAFNLVRLLLYPS